MQSWSTDFACCNTTASMSSSEIFILGQNAFILANQPEINPRTHTVAAVAAMEMSMQSGSPAQDSTWLKRPCHKEKSSATRDVLKRG